MQVYQDEVMRVAGFIVQASDEDGNGTWLYGMFDTEDQAVAFTIGLSNSVVETVYKPVKH